MRRDAAGAACGEPEADTDAGGRTGGSALPGDAAELSVARAGLETPESVLHDAEADVYLVSNINGEPLDRDDNGFISRLSPDGDVASLRWIDGGAEDVTLNAPKGLATHGDSLFAADIDVVRIFDRRTGEPMGEWPVEGAAFLNDLAVGPDGTLYVTDSAIGAEPDQAAVYRFDAEGEPMAVAMGAELNGPNGITADEQGLTVVTRAANQVYRLETGADMMAAEPMMLAELPAGGLDGVVALPDGSLLVSSWEGEAVYRVDADGMAEPVVESVPSPADIGYDTDRGRVLIPILQEDRVEIRPLR